MKKYLLEIVFYFLLPAALIAVVSEYSLRKIPNDYAYKNQWLTQNSRDVEVLALGSSCVLYGIAPQLLQKKGFNAAYFSQSLKYDHFIFNKFIDQMPYLEYVIIGMDYWSPFGAIEESPEWWRAKYYNIHYGSRFHRWEAKYNYELYFRNIETFKRAGMGFLTLLGLKNETYRLVNDLGYATDYTMNNRPVEWDNGESTVSHHNELIYSSSKGNIDQNRQFVEEIISTSADRNVKVMLVNFPMYKSYRNNRVQELVSQERDFYNYFVEKYENVFFHDFSADARFSENDFYDANHLNEKGAEKFTRILDSIMVHQSTPLFTKNKIK